MCSLSSGPPSGLVGRSSRYAGELGCRRRPAAARAAPSPERTGAVERGRPDLRAAGAASPCSSSGRGCWAPTCRPSGPVTARRRRGRPRWPRPSPRPPTVVAGRAEPVTPSAVLQPYAERVRVESGTDFVVVMSPPAIRYTHPDPQPDRQQFLGHIAEDGARRRHGRRGLHRHARPVPPGRNAGQRRRTGSSRSSPSASASPRSASRLRAPAAGPAPRRARRRPALGPRAPRSSPAASGGRPTASARSSCARCTSTTTPCSTPSPRACSSPTSTGGCGWPTTRRSACSTCPADAVGRPVAELGLAAPLAAALTDRRRARGRAARHRGPRARAQQRPRRVARATLLGHVATLRDRTDLEDLTGELDSARGLTEALRSQAHESANRLHTIVSLIELGHTDRALDFATDELAASQVLTDRVVGSVEEPALTALLLGKAAQAHERGIAFEIAPSAHWPAGCRTRRATSSPSSATSSTTPSTPWRPRSGERRVRVDARVDDGYAVLAVEDTGPGLPPGEVDEGVPARLLDQAAGGGGPPRHSAWPSSPSPSSAWAATCAWRGRPVPASWCGFPWRTGHERRRRGHPARPRRRGRADRGRGPHGIRRTGPGLHRRGDGRHEPGGACRPCRNGRSTWCCST